MSEDRDLLRVSLDIADGHTSNPMIESALLATHPISGAMTGAVRDIAHIADFYRMVHRPLATDLANGSDQNRWGHLELQELLGRGAYGVVYRALDPHLRREVALKILPDDPDLASGQALEEARRLACLKHPNIVTIFGADRRDGQAGLWMELIEGRTLEELLASEGPWNAREAARVGLDLCRALAAVHAAGLVHRDLKPANVMREWGGRTILMDLGIGGPLKPDREAGSPGPPPGTPLFCAPEVLAGGPAGPRSDIYSLGVLLDHLVSGSYPVKARTLTELTRALEAGDLCPLRDRRPDLDLGFIAVVERATHPDPLKRFASAGELERALAEWERAATGQAGGSSGAPSGPARAWKRAGLLFAVAAAALLIGGLARDFLRPVASPSFRAEASLFMGTTDPPRLLNPGSLVQPGDRLFMEFEGSCPLYVYLINEDDQGDAFVLFPLPGGMDLENPLPAGTHRLPPAKGGIPYSWGVSSAGGQEHFLVVASRQPVPLLEDLLRSLPAAGSLEGLPTDARPIPARDVGRLRGVGVLLPEPTATDRAPRKGAIAGVKEGLGVGLAGTEGLWVQRIDLANPR